MKCGCDGFTCWLRDGGITHAEWEEKMKSWGWVESDGVWHEPLD